MDLYNIPNDIGHPWRLHKCLDWIANFPNEIVPSVRLLSKKYDWSNDDLTWFIFLYSACYSYPSAVIMKDLLDYKTLTEEQFDKFWLEYKPKVIFQSDRRYIKNMTDQFKTIIFEFLQRSNRRPYEYISRFVTDDKVKTYENLYEEVSSWRYYARFGTILFMYNYMQIMNVDMDYPGYDWIHGATTTSAIFNILYEDERANLCESKSCKTRIPYRVLPKSFHSEFTDIADLIGQELSRRTGKPYGIITISSDLCSFRKLFKGTRYNGFYVDRQQEELNTLESTLGEDKRFRPYLDNLWDYRKQTLDPKYLGELNGWDGIQKEYCKSFLQTGSILPPIDQKSL